MVTTAEKRPKYNDRSRPGRRMALATLGAALFAPRAFCAGRPAVVAMLGDSITAGFGLQARDALPARLGEALGRRGVDVVIRPAGVSGDTSADALARVDFSVQPDTTLCLVALGGNDLLQGVEPKVLHDNLQAIIRRLKARKIIVVVAGMRAPPAIGPDYARAFNAVYPALAHSEHIVLYPFLLDGVASNGWLNQADGIHPNAAGVKIIADRIAPTVAQALASRR
ncbi:MAG TPA: arylesterase [Caulobacteraceae bacterium]|jgi:acyl-CoA thioesterase-1|nr:arylesterase [Caulobacteraceae bacterium]